MKVSVLSRWLCVVIFIAFGLNGAGGVTTECALRKVEHGWVCVCNLVYCDYLDPVNPTGDNEFVIVSSSKGGLRFATKCGQFEDGTVEITDPDDLEGENDVEREKNRAKWPNRHVSVNVDRSMKFQTIVGFGGALTGAVAHNLELMRQELQDAVYRSYYSPKGLGYNLLRMSIGGCDFDVEPWAYNEFPQNDNELTSFTSLDPRDEKKIEQMERLKLVTGIEEIKIMGAAWSPPKWMKTNNDWTGNSRLKKIYYQTWADYHLRFIELMDAKKMPIWAISTGNEPSNGVFLSNIVSFMSLGWTPATQAVWVADHLGPTIKKSKYKDVKLFGHDDQTYAVPTWFIMMNRTRTNLLDYIDGIATHFYWDQFFSDPVLLDITHRMFPDKLILNTETCLGDKQGADHAPLLGLWERAERYAHSYLEDLQHEHNGYIDWNLILDEKGGPNYVDNLVDAPIIVNVTSGREMYKQPIFYAIGHISKFVPEGSVRIQADRSNINIVSAAFQRPDGRISVVLFNSGKADVDVTLVDSVRGKIVITIPERSLHTVVYN